MSDQINPPKKSSDEVKSASEGQNEQHGIKKFLQNDYPKLASAVLSRKPDELDRDVFSPEKMDASRLYSDNPNLKSKQVEVQRNQLLESLAQADKSPSSMNKFKSDMQSFESRMKSTGIPDEKIAETYGNINKLLTSESKVTGLDASKRTMLAEDFMADAAKPEAITQGEHNSCSVTTIGKIMMLKDPAKASAMTTSLALDGQYKASDGKIITTIPGSLLPFSEEMRHHQDNKGGRSYAQQLLNIGLANDALQRRSPAQWYYQVEPKNMLDTGERVISQNGTLLGKRMFDGTAQPADHPGLTDSEIGEELRRQTNDNQTILIGKSRVDSDITDEANSKPDPTFDFGHFRTDAVTSIPSPDSLKDKLTDLQNSGKLPAIVSVDYSNPAFTKNPMPGAHGNWHVVLATKIDPVTSEVTVVDSEPGRTPERTVPVGSLYSALSETPAK